MRTKVIRPNTLKEVYLFDLMFGSLFDQVSQNYLHLISSLVLKRFGLVVIFLSFVRLSIKSSSCCLGRSQAHASPTSPGGEVNLGLHGEDRQSQHHASRHPHRDQHLGHLVLGGDRS